MSHVTFTVSVAGIEEGGHDELAARFILEKENSKRAKADRPLLPVGTFIERKVSYISFLSGLVQQAHKNYIAEQATEQAKAENFILRWLQANDGERSAALAALPAVTEHE